MNRENASFLLGGIILGFLVGFSISYALYRQDAVMAGGGFANAPAPVNPSDPGGRGAASGGAVPSRGAGGEDPTAVMERARQRLTSLRQALDANPKDPAILAQLGNVYYDASMYQEAKDYYLQSLEQDPNNPNVSTDLGICLRRLGDQEAALDRFRKSIEIAPRHWQSWLNLGIVSLFDAGDIPTAEEAFAKVKELNPGFEGMPQLEQALEHARSGGKF